MQKDDTSNIQNETAEELVGAIEGLAGGVGGELQGIEADADVAVLLVQTDDASNIQNEIAEEIASEVEGLAGGVGGELRAVEADADVAVLLVQEDDTSNIQNEIGANGVSRAEGCISRSSGGTTAMGEELSSACGPVKAPLAAASATPRGGTSHTRGEDESACGPAEGPTGIASATPSAKPSGKGQAPLSKREKKRLRWEAQMKEVERRQGKKPQEQIESPAEMIEGSKHLSPEMAKLLRRHYLPRSP